MADNNSKITPQKYKTLSVAKPEVYKPLPIATANEDESTLALRNRMTYNPYVQGTTEHDDYNRYENIQNDQIKLYNDKGNPQVSPTMLLHMGLSGLGDTKKQEDALRNTITGIDRFMGDKKMGKLSPRLYKDIMYSPEYSTVRLDYNINSGWIQNINDPDDPDAGYKVDDEMFSKAQQYRDASLSRWKLQQKYLPPNPYAVPHPEGNVLGQQLNKIPGVAGGIPATGRPLSSLIGKMPAEQYSETVQEQGDPFRADKTAKMAYSAPYVETQPDGTKVNRFSHGSFTSKQLAEAQQKAQYTIYEEFDRKFGDPIIDQMQADLDSGALKINAKTEEEYRKQAKQIFEQRLKQLVVDQKYNEQDRYAEELSRQLGILSPDKAMPLGPEEARKFYTEGYQDPVGAETDYKTIQQRLAEHKAAAADDLTKSSYYNYKYAPKTKVPIDVEKVKNDAGQDVSTAVRIGNVQEARTNLLSEFDRTFINLLQERYNLTGDSRYNKARMQYVTSAIRDIISTEQGDEGLADEAKNLFYAHKRIDWAWNLFGLDGEMEALIGEDKYLKQVVDSYKERFQTLRSLTGIRNNYGSKIDASKLNEYDVSEFILGPSTQFARGMFGWTSSSIDRGIKKLGTELNKEAAKPNNVLGIGNAVWNTLTSTVDEILNNGEQLQAPMGAELRAEIRNAVALSGSDPRTAGLRDDFLVEKVTDAVAHLYGSIKGGSFRAAAHTTHVGSSSLKRAWEMTKNPELVAAANNSPVIARIAEAINSSPKLQKILQNTVDAEGKVVKESLLRKTGDYVTNEETMLSVSSRGAATFALAHILEDFPEATPESILQGGINGLLFTSTGKMLADYIFTPIIKRTSTISKALNDPEVVRSLAKDFGGKALQFVQGNAQRQKDLAYGLANTVGNPLQGYIVQTSQGNDYDLSAFLIDALIGAPAGRALVKAHGKQGVNYLDLETLSRKAEAEENAEMLKRYRQEHGIKEDETPETKQEENLTEDIKAKANAEAGVPPEPQAPKYTAGERVQYVVDNAEQFKNPRKIRAVSEDGKFVYVYGVKEPIAVEHIVRKSTADQNTEEPVTNVRANDEQEVIQQMLFEEEAEQQRANGKTTTSSKSTKDNIPSVTPEYTPITVAERVQQIPEFYEQMTDIQKRVWNEVIMPLAGDGIMRYSPKATTYDRANKEININYELRDTPDEVNAIVHEAFHRATAEMIDTSPELQEKLVVLADRLRTNAEFKKWSMKNPDQALYMLQNPHELLVGLLDNRHGINDMLSQRTRLGGAVKDLFNTKIMGYETGIGDVLQQFNNILEQFVPKQTDTAQNAIREGAEQGAIANDLRGQEAIDQNNLESMDDLISRYDNEIDTSHLGMFRKFRNSLYSDSDASGFITNNDQLKSKYAQYYIELQRHGLDHPVYMDAITERIASTIPNWSKMNPTERADVLLDAVNQRTFTVPDGFKAELDKMVEGRQLAEKLTESMEMEELVVDKRTLSKILGDEHISEIENWLEERISTPDKLRDELLDKVRVRMDEINVEPEIAQSILSQTKDFAVNYIRNHSNLRKVAALAFGKTADGKITLAETEGEIRDPNSGVKHQHHIANPDPFIQRLKTLRNEVLFDTNNELLDMFKGTGDSDSIHVKIINALTDPNIEMGRMADYNQLIESGLFNDATSVGRQLLQHGWFLTSKGHKANIFLKLDFIARNNSPAITRQYIKAIEEINLVRYLNSERTVGVGNKQNVARGLNVFDLWKLVELAQSNRSIFDNDNAFKAVLRPKVSAKQDWLQHALKNRGELTAIGNLLIEKLRDRYQEYRGYTPEILHKQDNLEAAIVNAVNTFYHKVQDHGNLNDLPVVNGKLVKDQTKYWGVSFQSNGYWRYKNAMYADAVMKAINPGRLPFNIEGKSPDEIKEIKQYWQSHGIDIRDDGRATVKQFILSDEWAKANPAIWSGLSGQSLEGTVVPPSKYTDGASWIINKNFYDVLADLNNFDANTSGNIKYASGSEWIYKSDMTPLYDTGNIDVDSFLYELNNEGFTSITTQSAIKSKANNYLRAQTERLNENVVFDHDGTLIGIEDTATNKLTALNADQLNQRYAGMAFAPELIRSYDMFGENAWSYVNHANGAPKQNDGITFNLPRHAYTLGMMHGDDIAKQLTSAYHNVRLNLVDEWRELYNGAYAIDAQEGTIVKNKSSVNFVRSLIRRLENVDPSDMPWQNQQHQEYITKVLQDAIIDNETVLTSAIRHLDTVYGNILRGDHSLRIQLLNDQFKKADKVKVTGTQMRIMAYTPKEHHVPAGIEETLHWTRLAAEEEARHNGLTGEEKAAYIEARAEETNSFINNTVLPKILPTGRLEANDSATIISRNQLRSENEKIRKMRERGAKVPYLGIGSKVIIKLNPADGIQSFAPRVIVGVDLDSNAGIMVNHDNLVNELGRDFDGDELSLLYNNSEWERDGRNTFEEVWGVLYKVGAHKGDKYAKIGADPANLKAAHGHPYQRQVNDRRIIGMDGYDKQLTANASSGNAIKDGINALNSFYELAQQRGVLNDLFYAFPKDPQSNVVFRHNSWDLTNIKVSDIYTKTAQYDTYGGYEVSPLDVFLGSRVHKIDYYTENETPNERIKAMVDNYNSTGHVSRELYNMYVRTIKQNTRTVDTKNMLNVLGRLNPVSYGQSAELAKVISDARKTTQDEHIKLYNAINNVAKQFTGNNRNIVEGVQDLLANYGQQPLQAKYNPSNAIKLNPTDWQVYTSTARSTREWRTQSFHIREMLGRLFTHEAKQIDINEAVAYKGTRNGLYLTYNGESLPAYEIFQRNGGVHPLVGTIMAEQGLTFEQLFPRNIIGHVEFTPIIGTKLDKTLEDMLIQNKDVTIIRGTMFDANNISRDKSSQYLKYDNFRLVPYAGRTSPQFEGDLAYAIRSEIAKGRRVIIDANTMGRSGDPRVVKAGILDIGRDVKQRRFYDTREVNKLIGKAYATLGGNDTKAPALAMQLAGEMMVRLTTTDPESLTNTQAKKDAFGRMYEHASGQLYQVYEGIREAGGRTDNADGTDILRSIIANAVKADFLAAANPERLEETTPLEEREGRKLGLFNGSVRRLRGTELKQGRSGAINRLNKLLGRDILTMTSTEINDVTNTISEWVRDEFPEIPADQFEQFAERIIHAFDPKLMSDMEKGMYAEIRAQENGDAKLLAHKSVFMLQFLQQAEEFKKAFTAGKLKDWRFANGILAEQSTEAMVRYFANDSKLYNGATPIYDRIGIRTDYEGRIVPTTTQVLLRDTYDKLLTMPRLVSMESATAMRHQRRHQYLSMVKDQWAASIPNVREQIKGINPNNDPNFRPTSFDINLVKDHLAGNEALFVRKPNADPTLPRVAPAPPALRMRVSYDGGRTPQIIASVMTPTGLVEFATGEDGAFALGVLDQLSAALQPDSNYMLAPDFAATTTVARIDNVIKHAIIFKANNLRQAAFQEALAQGINQHVDFIRRSNNDVDENGTLVPQLESIFAKEIALAANFANDLQQEALARINSGLVENLDATTYVNYDEMSELLTDYLERMDAELGDAKISGKYDRWRNNIEELAQYATRFGVKNVEGTDFEVGQRVFNKLRQRHRFATDYNEQITKTTGKFAADIMVDAARPAIYDPVDSNIMHDLFGQEATYNEDVIFRRNQEVIQSATNKLNAVFLNLYRTEKAFRSRFGMEYLSNTVAENNLITDMSADGLLYNTNIDVTVETGLRKLLAENERLNQQRYLDENQLGVAPGTPVSVTYATRADLSEMQSINGRLLGAVRLSHSELQSKRLKEAEQALRMELDKIRKSPEYAARNPLVLEELNKKAIELQRMLVDDSVENKTKDMLVMMNQRTGTLSYIDMSAISNVTAGKPIGNIAGAIETTQGRYLIDRFGSYDDLAKFLVSDIAVKTMKTIDLTTNRVNTQPLLESSTPKNIPFFATIGREKLPPTVKAKALNLLANSVGNFASHYNHGMGKQMIGTGLGLMAIPVSLALGDITPAASLLLYNASSAGKKFFVNALGNRWGFAPRSSMIFQNADSILSQYKRIASGAHKIFSENRTLADTGVAASLLSRRLSQGVGVVADTFSTDRAAQEQYDTIQYAKLLAEMQPVKDIVDGWGRVLTKDDLVVINELVNKYKRSSSKIEASIIQGQLSLRAMNAQGEYIANMSEINAMNIDAMNRVLVMSGQLGLLAAPATGLAKVNATRLAAWHMLGSTEQQGLENAAAEAIQEFRRTNVDKPILSNPDAVTNFAGMGIDILQGKFDQRPVNMKSPLGRLYTLFSQYRRNFDRQTILGWNQQRQFWKDFYELHRDDEDFRRAVITNYGVDIGDQRVQAAYMAWDKRDMSPAHAWQLTQAQKNMALHALTTRGLEWLIKGALLGQMYQKIKEQYGEAISMGLDAGFEQIVGSSSRFGELVGNLIYTLGQSAVYYATEGEEDSEEWYMQPLLAVRQTDEAYSKDLQSTIRETAEAVIPGGGFIVSPVRQHLGLFGARLGYELGWMPVYREPDLVRPALRTLSTVAPPVGIASDVYLQGKEFLEGHELIEKDSPEGTRRSFLDNEGTTTSTPKKRKSKRKSFLD